MDKRLDQYSHAPLWSVPRFRQKWSILYHIFSRTLLSKTLLEGKIYKNNNLLTWASTTQNWLRALSKATSVFPDILAIVFLAALRTPIPALHQLKREMLSEAYPCHHAMLDIHKKANRDLLISNIRILTSADKKT